MRKLDLEVLQNIDWTSKHIDVTSIYEDKSVYDHFVYLYGEYVKTHHQDYIQYFWKALEYTYVQSCKLSRLKLLTELITIDNSVQEGTGVPKCPICGIHFKDMQSHVKRSHDISWNEFIYQFDYSYPTVYFSEEHCRKLSKNKIHFYRETEEGMRQRKEDLHLKYSGKNNPACREDVRLKISRSRQRLKGKGSKRLRQRHSEISCESARHNENMLSSGYVFWTFVKGDEIRFRSKAEYLIKTMLEYYNISFSYEPMKVVYFDADRGYERTYLPDFEINGELYEVKYDSDAFEHDNKYHHIQNHLSSRGLSKLKLVTPGTFLDVMEIPESDQKPQSFFADIVLNDIKEGKCKLIVPKYKNNKYFTSGLSFLYKLGDDPEHIIAEGAKLYEDKKHKGN